MVTSEKLFKQVHTNNEGVFSFRILRANSRLTREKWNPPPLFIGEGKGKYEPSHTISTVGSTQYQRTRSCELTPPDNTSHPHASSRHKFSIRPPGHKQIIQTTDYEQHIQN